MKIFKAILFDDSGQSLVEYSLILSLVVLVVVSAVVLFGDSVYDLYETIKNDVTNAL